MTSLPPELAAIRDEAMQISVAHWAGQMGWKLYPPGAPDRAGPCPLCGGKDRFSINTFKNIFNCRKCEIGGGGVISLVQQTQNVGFVEACEIITGRKAADPVDPEHARRMAAKAKADEERRRREAERYRENSRREGYALWKRAAAETAPGYALPAIVAEYLAVRGLPPEKFPKAVLDGDGRLRLRQIRNLDYTHKVDGNWQVIATGPAMIAPVQFDDGRFAGAHRTWIDPSKPKGKAVLGAVDGRMLPVKKMLGCKTRAAIRCYTPPHPRRIVMGEGIETTLTAAVYAFDPATAYWAGITLGNMSGKAIRDANNKLVEDQPDMEDPECFVPPEWCRELVYMAEGDEGDLNMQKLIRGIRRAMRARPGLKGWIVPAPGPGMDMNDIAMAMKQAEGVA